MVDHLPLNLDLVIGLDRLSRFGVVIRHKSVELRNVEQSNEKLLRKGPSQCSDLKKSNSLLINDTDFNASFKGGKRVISWRWKSQPSASFRKIWPKNLVKTEDQ